MCEKQEHGWPLADVVRYAVPACDGLRLDRLGLESEVCGNAKLGLLRRHFYFPRVGVGRSLKRQPERLGGLVGEVQ